MPPLFQVFHRFFFGSSFTDHPLSFIRRVFRGPSSFPLLVGAFGSNRNRCHFLPSLPSSSNHQQSKLSSCDDILARAREWFFSAHNHNSVKVTRTISVGWSKPHPGRFKLNLDGAVGVNVIGAGGGLIRGSEGQCVLSFNRHIGSSSALAGKLWALRDGLNMAWDDNI